MLSLVVGEIDVNYWFQIVDEDYQFWFLFCVGGYCFWLGDWMIVFVVFFEYVIGCGVFSLEGEVLLVWFVIDGDIVYLYIVGQM